MANGTSPRALTFPELVKGLSPNGWEFLLVLCRFHGISALLAHDPAVIALVRSKISYRSPSLEGA
jgi:hypothetical protein